MEESEAVKVFRHSGIMFSKDGTGREEPTNIFMQDERRRGGLEPLYERELSVETCISPT